MAKEPKQKWDKLTIGLGVGTIASVVLNVVLGAQLVGGGPSDDFDGSAATGKTFYEEQVSTLQAEKGSLEEQLAEANKKLAEAEDNAANDTNPESENETGSTDTVRANVQSTVNGFLDAFLNHDTGKVTNEQRRASLEPYVTSELLAQIAPNEEELADMGIVGDERDGEEADENAVPEYTYQQELDEKSIFIQDDTLDDKTVKVVAETLSSVDDSLDVSYEMNERYSLSLEKDGDSWKVVEYTLEKIN